jgi:hypothetical protein
MVVTPPIQESLDSTCKRWIDKQDVKDIKDLVRITPDQMKKGYPSSLIIVRDDQSRDRDRIHVPKL